jgi:type I restriction enzyme S subunit
VSAFKGTENEKAFISYDLYEDLAKRSGKVQEGDVLITGGGSIGIPYLVRNNAPLYFKDADLIWLKKSEELNGNFLYYFFTAPEFRAYVKSISHIGTIAHYTIEQVKDTPILLPRIDEQKKLAAFFDAISNLITLHQREYDKTVNIKKAMLEKMFPKNGEDKPEIRFKGFTDAWEQRKLGEVVDVRGGRDYKHLSDGDIPVYGTGGYMLSVNEALSYSEDAIGIGRKGTIDKPYLLRAPFWTVDTLFYAVPKDSNDLYFTHVLFQIIDWKQKDESTGVPSLSKTTINAVDILAPDTTEQKRIGICFAELDRLITLHQRELVKLQNMKKALLEKMFV